MSLHEIKVTSSVACSTLQSRPWARAMNKNHTDSTKWMSLNILSTEFLASKLVKFVPATKVPISPFSRKHSNFERFRLITCSGKSWIRPWKMKKQVDQLRTIENHAELLRKTMARIVFPLIPEMKQFSVKLSFPYKSSAISPLQYI